ncbi:hypothetical protein SAMN05518683_13223 [Salibacterium halotolerans]|uniref:Uncharacterized protein n=1 Tax=Salibacterium halotolerans TaxID=1884432 RepID=A0A1I5XXB8_9BACI|nr:hypothetical protein SAMN05518683_13223 [Salibacterium halotolerans]
MAGPFFMEDGRIITMVGVAIEGCLFPSSFFVPMLIRPSGKAGTPKMGALICLSSYRYYRLGGLLNILFKFFSKRG